MEMTVRSPAAAGIQGRDSTQDEHNSSRLDKMIQGKSSCDNNSQARAHEIIRQRTRGTNARSRDKVMRIK